MKAPMNQLNVKSGFSAKKKEGENYKKMKKFLVD